MKRLLTVCGLVGMMWMSGCATMSGKAQGYVGKDVNGLISEEGAPASTYAMPNGDTLYTFVSESPACKADYVVGPDHLVKSVNTHGHCGSRAGSAMAAGLKGFSNGYNESRRNQVDCQSISSGSYTRTSCQ